MSMFVFILPYFFFFFGTCFVCSWQNVVNRGLNIIILFNDGCTCSSPAQAALSARLDADSGLDAVSVPL